MLRPPLPEPPATLQGPAREFYDELRRMLDDLKPSKIDPEKNSVEFKHRSVEVTLAHTDRDDWPIWAAVGDRDAIVGAGTAHEHFFAPDSGVVEARPWTSEIVDFIAEIVRGEIEVETTFRGNTPISVRHFNLYEHGERRQLSYTAFLAPGRLLLWRPKRIETERLTFL
jgi:hypothetical protein